MGSDSAEIIVNLMRSSDAPPILFFGGYRVDEKAQSDFLNRWDSLQSENEREQILVEVGPLTAGQCADMMGRLVPAEREVLENQADELLRRTAGNPYLISPEGLTDDGLLDASPSPGFPDDRVDYGAVLPWKRELLARAHKRMLGWPDTHPIRQAFAAFRDANAGWLPEYMTFMALKEEHDLVSWVEWPTAYRDREPDAMAEAELGCIDCHTGEDGEVAPSMLSMCVDCHEEGYDTLAEEWIDETKAYETSLAELIAVLESSSLSEMEKTSLRTAKEALESVRKDGSRGVHNPDYVWEKMTKSIDDLEGIGTMGSE